MCKTHNLRKIDKCLRHLIEWLNVVLPLKSEILGCCCGHNKYPMTIIYKMPLGEIMDVVSGKLIHRKKKFYKKDKEGYYYVPKTIERIESD